MVNFNQVLRLQGIQVLPVRNLKFHWPKMFLLYTAHVKNKRFSKFSSSNWKMKFYKSIQTFSYCTYWCSVWRLKSGKVVGCIWGEGHKHEPNDCNTLHTRVGPWQLRNLGCCKAVWVRALRNTYKVAAAVGGKTSECDVDLQQGTVCMCMYVCESAWSEAVSNCVYAWNVRICHVKIVPHSDIFSRLMQLMHRSHKEDCSTIEFSSTLNYLLLQIIQSYKLFAVCSNLSQPDNYHKYTSLRHTKNVGYMHRNLRCRNYPFTISIGTIVCCAWTIW